MADSQTTDPVELWLRADSGAAKAVAGNALVQEINRLRSGIRTALGFYQVTHIHAALREVCND